MRWFGGCMNVQLTDWSIADSLHTLVMTVKGKMIPLHAMEALEVRGGTPPTHS
jgi:hypothetical protein